MTSSPTMACKLLMALAAVVSLLPLLARADSPTIVRIGALVPPVLISPEEGMRQGLTELGYREGKNVTIDRRLGETADALQAGAVDLVRSKVDVIVAFGTSAARAALSATSTIPVVFISGDPVAAGLAASLARPGANATGVSTVSTDLVPKRLELLQQIVPHMQRVILLGNPSTPLHPRVVEEAQLGARALRIQMLTSSMQPSSASSVAWVTQYWSAPTFYFWPIKRESQRLSPKQGCPRYFPGAIFTMREC
jgi:putative ABC transport system substrate-binding protein